MKGGGQGFISGCGHPDPWTAASQQPFSSRHTPIGLHDFQRFYNERREKRGEWASSLFGFFRPFRRWRLDPRSGGGETKKGIGGWTLALGTFRSSPLRDSSLPAVGELTGSCCPKLLSVALLKRSLNQTWAATESWPKTAAGAWLPCGGIVRKTVHRKPPAKINCDSWLVLYHSSELRLSLITSRFDKPDQSAFFCSPGLKFKYFGCLKLHDYF